MTKTQKQTRLQMPKSFDYNKLEVLGAYALRTFIRRDDMYGKSGAVKVFLMKYGKHMVYVPNMPMKEFKRWSPEIFQLFVDWCPFHLYDRDLTSDDDFSSIYYDKKRNLLPDYSFQEGNEPFYNLVTYKNRSNENQFHIQYGMKQEGDKTMLQEFLYKKDELISTSLQPFNIYQDVVYEKQDSYIVVNMKKGTETKIKGVERIDKITETYVVGANGRYRDECYVYDYQVFRKQDGNIVYGRSGYAESYVLIGDRYLAVTSFSKGVIDLETGETILYPFENTCENFISHVTKETFRDRYGTHHIENLPDLSWTGYETLAFLKKFGGFIPNAYHIGNTRLNGTGGYTRYNGSKLLFKNITEGLFYKKRNELINLETEQSCKVDDIMLSWIEENDEVYIFDKKPRDLKHFSILDALKKGKEIQGLFVSFRTLYSKQDNKQLATHFMKEEIIFDTNNLIDIKCNLTERNVKIELTCKVNNKKITFETDKHYNGFEVAAIS